jgi:GT2 family glycosyltransferase
MDQADSSTHQRLQVYSEEVEEIIQLSETGSEPLSSVVIVAYRIDEDEFRGVLDQLKQQTTTDFETIIVDNGGQGDISHLLEEFQHTALYVKLAENYGVTLARNLGATAARGDLLLFIDDDSIPEKDFVEQHVRAHRGNDIVAARGKVLTLTDNLYNRIQWWYDLGETAIPYFINTECNSSFEREVFLELSGFNEGPGGRAGHEGAELTYRMLQSGYDRDEIIYDPGPIVYHDNAENLLSYLRKQIRHRKEGRQLQRQYPELSAFLQSYGKPDQATDQINTTDRIAARAIASIVEVADRTLA